MYDPMQSYETGVENTVLPYEIKRQKQRVSALGWCLVLLLLLPQWMPAMLAVFLQGIFPNLIHDVTFSNVVFYLFLYGVALPLSLLILYPHKKDPLPQKSISFPKWLLFLVLALGLLYIGSFLTEFLMSFFENAFGVQNSLDTLLSELPAPLVLFLTLVCAPIGEEFIFRKLFIDRLHRYGTVVAVGVSSLFFALFHLNPYQIFYAFLLGCLLGYLYEKTGRLRYTVLLHLVANFFGGALPMLLQWLIGDLALEEPLVFENLLQLQGVLLMELLSLLILCLVVATIVLLAIFLWKKQVHLDAGSVPLSKTQKLKVILWNPGMICACAVTLALTVFSIAVLFA